MEIEDAKFLEFIARPRGLLFAWRMARQAFSLTNRVKHHMKRICLPPKNAPVAAVLMIGPITRLSLSSHIPTVVQ